MLFLIVIFLVGQMVKNYSCIKGTTVDINCDGPIMVLKRLVEISIDAILSDLDPRFFIK